MPSLFDIAKSGVQSYRQALAVTGQNIANINTDGYKRREAGLTEVSSGQGGITQIQDGTGLGVRVEDIKRSFDAYLLDRKRNSFSRIGKYLVYHRTTIKRMYDKILDALTNKIIKEKKFYEELTNSFENSIKSLDDLNDLYNSRTYCLYED